MDKTLSYFVYSPPKSNSHGHGVRDKNVRRATQRLIDSFVSSFKATTDNRLQLTLSHDKNNELQKARNTIEKLNNFLGTAKREWDNAGFEKMENTMTWENENANILDLLDYIDKLKDDSFLPLSKYWISCFYHYGKSPEPYGHIMCSIESGRLFVRLHLIIPYPIDNDKCYELIYKFHKSLPFKLNGNHFRRLGPSKRGYGQWKLDEETQNRLNECLIKSKMK
ncbi:hypothetical protein [Cytophaga hutchinsonii]|uniref:Uncharacterized protein n=1 Tax=Cytophaga hutchinsonii (strain ATCC 33406 / DSM 1761 / CIP 103989 / NBRC 15051 / NCIMB 9469 / D465) TaxID=269798 RepID=A0A6N4STM2_CYTH3|nr:hypothetical protein [Cytophaga hutchinsonii]ABG59733.1 hypothetical protein CHU_2479 [Cytophaga hutchinsonii ATCC 33406]SFX65205.1 hypothetical protein SAMN04487930_10754 [Cytophaga hutchinsonii ATCC 33406]